MKLAIYKNVEVGSLNGWTFVNETTLYEGRAEYVRISEIVEVEFPMLPPTATVEAELAAINKAEAEFDAKVYDKKQEFKDQRSKLLAITHQPEQERA